MNESYAPPFDEALIGGKLGEGLENVVYEMGKDVVVKQVNKLSGERFGIPELTEYLQSEQHLKDLSSDYKNVKEILGEYMADTIFVRGYDRETGKKTNYQIQEKIAGSSLEEFFKISDSQKTEEFYIRNRDQLLEILWGAKEVFIRYGIPLDLLQKNIIVEEAPDKNEDTIKVIDLGFVEEGSKIIFDNYCPELIRPEIRITFAQICLHRLQQLNDWEFKLKVTDEEKERLDNRPGHEIKEDVFMTKKKRLQDALLNLQSLYNR